MSLPLEGQEPSADQLDAWIERFHEDGYLVLKNVLSRERCHRLRTEFTQGSESRVRFRKRLFETSPANLALFDLEPIVTFAEQLIGRTTGLGGAEATRGGIGGANVVHVIHNNSFVTYARSEGLAKSAWHQDDTPHILTTDGQPLKNVRLNVLAFTVNYYLTDVLDEMNGPTQVIPGSHLFGRFCEGDVREFEDRIVSCTGPAGTAVCFNNQVWHRGGPNRSEQDRFITQVTYAKRLVGHKYGSIMNYRMPKHVYEGASPRLSRLLGFLPGGAYS